MAVKFLLLLLMPLLSLPEIYSNPRKTPFSPLGYTPLIVGGLAATEGQFPYQLALMSQGKYKCGASLVQINGFQVALTAAQCNTDSILDLTLVAGEHNLHESSGSEQIGTIRFIANHPGYTASPVYHNDIAVIFLDEQYQLGDNVQPIKLPEIGRVADNKNLTVSGWGMLWESGPFPNLPHYVTIPVVNTTTCRLAWAAYGNEIVDGQLCAGESTGELSPCTGDQGGPAVSEDGELLGIVSWGWGKP